MSTPDVTLGQADLGTAKRETLGTPRDIASGPEAERWRELARLEVEEMVVKIRKGEASTVSTEGFPSAYRSLTTPQGRFAGASSR